MFDWCRRKVEQRGIGHVNHVLLSACCVLSVDDSVLRRAKINKCKCIQDPTESQIKGKWRFCNFLIYHEAGDSGRGGVKMLILPVERVRRQKQKMFVVRVDDAVLKRRGQSFCM